METRNLKTIEVFTNKKFLYKLMMLNKDGQHDAIIKSTMKEYDLHIDVADFIKLAKQGIDGVSKPNPAEIFLKLIDGLVRLGAQGHATGDSFGIGSFTIDDVFIAINALPTREAKLPYIKQILDKTSSLGKVVWAIAGNSKFFAETLETYKRIYKAVSQYYREGHYKAQGGNDKIGQKMDAFFGKNAAFEWAPVIQLIEEECLNPNIKYFVSLKRGANVIDKEERSLADIYIEEVRRTGESSITVAQLRQLLLLGLDPNNGGADMSMLDADLGKFNGLAWSTAGRIEEKVARGECGREITLLEFGGMRKEAKSSLLILLGQGIENAYQTAGGLIGTSVNLDLTKINGMVLTKFIELLNYEVREHERFTPFDYKLIATWLYENATSADATRSMCLNLKPHKEGLFEAIKTMDANTATSVLHCIAFGKGAITNVFWEGHTDPKRGRLKKVFDEYKRRTAGTRGPQLFVPPVSPPPTPAKMDKDEQEMANRR